jgi:transcription elongation factor Elf1
MWVIWGPVSGVKDIGIVAERCPHCGRLSQCRVTAHSQGFHLYFVTLASGVRDAVCTCSSCGGQFRCELWRYPNTVSDVEASTITMERLLERTNPTLKGKAWVGTTSEGLRNRSAVHGGRPVRRAAEARGLAQGPDERAAAVGPTG